MRIVHINLSDSQGGAAVAARRLHLALRQAGHDFAHVGLAQIY